MTTSILVNISLVFGFFCNSISSFFNIYIFFISIILFRKNLITFKFINKNIVLSLFIIISSNIIFHIFTSSKEVFFPITDYFYIFTAISFAYYLTNIKFLDSFVIFAWRIGIIMWIIYIFLYIRGFSLGLEILPLGTSLYSQLMNNALSQMNMATNGLIFKPLISIIFLIPLVLYIYSSNDLKKKLIFCPVIKNKFIRILSIIFFTFLLPSRSLTVGLISLYLIDFVFKINYKNSKFLIQFFSLTIPSLFLSLLLSLNLLVKRIPELIAIDYRSSVWLESIDFLNSNPLSFFVGPGYSQVDNLVGGNLAKNLELQEFIKNIFSQIELDHISRLYASSSNESLLGFESDFVNGIFGFGLIPVFLITSFLFYRCLCIIFLNIDKGVYLYYETHRTFGRIMLPLLIGLLFEDRLPYLIIWVLLFTLISIPKKKLINLYNEN